MGVLRLLMLPQILPKCRRHLKSHSIQRKRPVSNFSWSINVFIGNCEMMLVEILCCLHSSFHFFFCLFPLLCSVGLSLIYQSSYTYMESYYKQNVNVHRLRASPPSPDLYNARKPIQPFQSCVKIRLLHMI